MIHRLKYVLAFSCCAVPTIAQVALTPPVAPPTPDVTFTGAELDQIYKDLSIPDLYHRQDNGSMVPVMNTGTEEAMKLITAKVKDQITATAKAKADADADTKKKADAVAASKAAPTTQTPAGSPAPDATKTP